jgi:hypothetical protein
LGFFRGSTVWVARRTENAPGSALHLWVFEFFLNFLGLLGRLFWETIFAASFGTFLVKVWWNSGGILAGPSQDPALQLAVVFSNCCFNEKNLTDRMNRWSPDVDDFAQVTSFV